MTTIEEYRELAKARIPARWDKGNIDAGDISELAYAILDLCDRLDVALLEPTIEEVRCSAAQVEARDPLSGDIHGWETAQTILRAFVEGRRK